MTFWLIVKALIPHILVSCSFYSIVRLRSTPLVGVMLVMIILSEIMCINFFNLVRSEGTWLEIGIYIAEFGIFSANIILVVLNFSLSRLLLWGVPFDAHKSAKAQ